MAKLSARSQSGTPTSSSLVHVVNDPSGTPTSSKETLGSVGESGGLNTVTTGISASTTQTQVAATALTTVFNFVSTVSNDDDAVKLTDCAAGIKQVVFNESSNILQLFPASGDDLGAGTDTSIQILPGEFGVFTGKSGSDWNRETSENVIDDYKITSTSTLSRKQMFGGVITVTTAATLTLLAGETGMHLSIGAVAATSVNPDGSEVQVLNGTALTGGNEIDIAAGSMATWHWDDTDSRWIVWGGSDVTDGGA